MSNTNLTHPEQIKENSLTSPEDRDRVNKWRPAQNIPALNNDETNEAMKELNNTSFTDKFQRIDRTYADPPLPMQFIGLISFTPAKGATPNENGVFGFAKLRGNFASEIEASQRAELIVRNYDSHHQIYHTYVGRPFPITNSSKYSAETSEIDIRKEMITDISKNIKDQKIKDAENIRDIREREEKLIEESKQEKVDEYEEYITLSVKKAQLSWTFLEHQKKMAEVKDIIIKTREQLEKADKEYPEFKNTYYEKYMKARENAGLKDDFKESFLKFLVEDADLGF